MTKTIALLPGDGLGPEITAPTVELLSRLADFAFEEHPFGGDTTDPAKPRPEQGLLGRRKGLGLYANLRPVRPLPALYDASPLKREVIEGVDMLIVRELTGGLYYGERGTE